jgi:hypothetical protein
MSSESIQTYGTAESRCWVVTGVYLGVVSPKLKLNGHHR